MNPQPCLILMNQLCHLPNISTLSAEKLITIDSEVCEIWPGKVKSGGAFIQAGTFIQQNAVSKL